MNQLQRRAYLMPNISQIHRAIDQIFHATPLKAGNGLTKLATLSWRPTIDIKEEKKQYIVCADLPGVASKNIQVSIENGLLTIRGHRESETKEEKNHYVHVERSAGSFFRTIALPHMNEKAKIIAKAKNGVLEIKIPKLKTTAATTKRIQITEAK